MAGGKLPLNLPSELRETRWKAILDQLLSNATLKGSLLPGIVLTSGSNTVNHKLGRQLQGWIVVGQNAAATFYDQQASNKTPATTLLLVASAQVTVNLYVF
jgi:hypothetical protein